MNVVSLIGNLTAAPELRDVGENKVCRLRVAVDRHGKDSGTDYLDVSAWNGLGESCAKFLTKGRRIAVEGRLRSRSWDQDGSKRYAVEVVASSITFLGAPVKETPAATAT